MSRKKKTGCNPLVGVLVLGAVFLVALVGALFVGKIMLNKWLQGDGLQSLLREKARTELDAKVEIDEVRWEGMKAFAGKISAHGYPDAAFARLDLNNIGTNFNGVKNQAFDIPSISVNQMFAEFSNDRIEETVVVSEASPAPATTKSELPGWLKNFLPNRTVIDEVVIGSANIEVKNDQSELTMAIKETRATIHPDLDTGVMKIKAQNGTLQLEGSPELSIRDSSMRFQGSSLFINDASLEIYDGGHISGQGEIAFEDETTFDLDLELSGVDIKKVVKPDWKSKVTGTVRGPVKVTGTSDQLVQKGTLNLEDGVIEAIPLLDQIGQYTKNKRFNRLVLNQAQADFTKVGDLLELRNIQIESDGLTRVEGVLDMQGEALSGVFQVGVTPGTLRWIPGAEKDVFTEKRDGFVWTTMKLGGTTAQINEDLSGRLMVAAAADIVNKLPGSLQEQLKGILGVGNPTGPPADENSSKGGNITDRVKDLMIDETGDTGKKLLDLLNPFFGN